MSATVSHPKLVDVPSDPYLMHNRGHFVFTTNGKRILTVGMSGDATYTEIFTARLQSETEAAIQGNKWKVEPISPRELGQFRLFLTLDGDINRSYVTTNNNKVRVQKEVGNHIEFTFSKSVDGKSLLLANGYYLNWDPVSQTIGRSIYSDPENRIIAYWFDPEAVVPVEPPTPTEPDHNCIFEQLIWAGIGLSVATVGVIAANCLFLNR